MNASVGAGPDETAPAGTDGPAQQAAGRAAASGPAAKADAEEDRRRVEENEARDAVGAAEAAGGGVASMRAVTPAPAPAAAPVSESVTVTADESKKEVGAEAREAAGGAARADEIASRNRANQTRNIENQQTPDGSRNQSRQAQNLGNFRNEPSPPPAERESAKAKAPADARRRPAAPGRGGGAAAPAGEKPADRGQAETRDVAGRRFRRQNGVWVDTDFRDSLPSVGVRRGTEAYRALVAELPEVGRAAEALAGEVVVVARGRAYRVKP
jgi:hypothetical protein